MVCFIPRLLSLVDKMLLRLNFSVYALKIRNCLTMLHIRITENI